MAYTVKLKDRGNSVIGRIDLFDECHYGADKLFLRGKFGTPQDVAEQIKIALGGGNLDVDKIKETYGEMTEDELETFKKTKLGIGNPLTPEDESGVQTIPTIALNRYHIPDKKFWNNVPTSGVANPYKASAAVTFSIRLYFRDDFAYITFGCPWYTIMNEETGDMDDDYAEQNNGLGLIRHFKLLNCHFISKEDAITVLDNMGLEVDNWDQNVSVTRIIQEVLELSDENGVVFSA